MARAFDALDVRWAVGGSLASTTYGEPRATNDIDVVAALTSELAADFARRLGDDFYADEAAAAEAASRHASFNVLDQRTLLKVDVFIPPAGPIGEGQLERRRRIALFPANPPVPVLAPEDTVLHEVALVLARGRGIRPAVA